MLHPGSGGGIDVLLSARRVGPPARLTVSLDRQDAGACAREPERAGITTVEFLKGEIKRIPPIASLRLTRSKACQPCENMLLPSSQTPRSVAAGPYRESTSIEHGCSPSRYTHASGELDQLLPRTASSWFATFAGQAGWRGGSPTLDAARCLQAITRGGNVYEVPRRASRAGRPGGSGGAVAKVKRKEPRG